MLGASRFCGRRDYYIRRVASIYLVTAKKISYKRTKAAKIIQFSDESANSCVSRVTGKSNKLQSSRSAQKCQCASTRKYHPPSPDITARIARRKLKTKNCYIERYYFCEHNDKPCARVFIDVPLPISSRRNRYFFSSLLAQGKRDVSCTVTSCRSSSGVHAYDYPTVVNTIVRKTEI